ncbi:MAG TPA: cytochrome c peroxidase [Cryomorphaceae bacterium]|nr:cytochrome c peroxidase [Cryomorphaceae bacterium]
MIPNLKAYEFSSRMFTVGIITCLVIFASCKKDESENEASLLCENVSGAGTPYEFEKPFFFPDPVLPADNPFTEEGIELGRHLFWEKKLSRNNAVSCGSCHFPSASFSDNAPKSVGLYGDLTPRNSMALVNMAWNTSFFWDGRARTLEEQLLEPIENPIEMDLTWSEAVERIGTDSAYQEMFTAAFGTPCVDSVRITYAMAQFIRTMVSANSEFDQVQYGPAQLSLQEQNGLNLFLAEGGDPNIYPGGQNGGDCFHCHGGALVLFTDQQFHNNGLDSVFTDLGRALVNGSPFSEGQFKTPTLRNIALTAPYMHDGRFETLQEVIEHYNSGGHPSATVDPLMKFQGVGLGLSEQDIDDLVAFLETLTDDEFVNNPDFQDPH